jgi:hypothetical protein
VPAIRIRRTPQLGQKPRRLQRDELLGVTGHAALTQKTVLEAAAFQVCREFLLHVLRERPASRFARRDELWVASLDELAEQRLLGSVAHAGAPARSPRLRVLVRNGSVDVTLRREATVSGFLVAAPTFARCPVALRSIGAAQPLKRLDGGQGRNRTFDARIFSSRL